LNRKKYFVLHAPRQTGKTSVLYALQAHLNMEGHYHCVYANVEVAQGYREQVHLALNEILQNIAHHARDVGDMTAEQTLQQLQRDYPNAPSLSTFLTRWAQARSKPIVLLIDEIDSLVGDTLISVLRQLRAGYPRFQRFSLRVACLRQLRAGYPSRPQAFPSSVVLCGVRDVRDYRLTTPDGKSLITGGSAFNIKAESLRLGDFSRVEVEQLYTQHTTETGQSFTPEAIERAWQLTQGQPWLVNALAYETCFKMREGRDRSQSITTLMLEQAKENLVMRRETHLDQLADKLKEERVRRVIEPLLTSETDPSFIPLDDVEYVEDLGLIRSTPNLALANPIYQEVIPRTLTYSTQRTITQETVWYVRTDGTLDLPKLLAAFQQFFRENSERWLERFDYREAGPQLLVQAFLQRIINGGGFVLPEYGLGRRRTDVLVRWRYVGGEQRVVLELKVVRGSVEATIKEGLVQTVDYMDKCGADEGHLLVFDRDERRAWEEKIFVREERVGAKAVWVWGM
jgi:hypothetical protein